MGSAAEPGPDTEDPSSSPVRHLVKAQLADADAVWTMGAGAAGVRFGRENDETVARGPGSAITARGGIRLTLPASAVVIAYETPSTADPLRWEHAVAFCLPAEEARRPESEVVTELGPDTQALRPRDNGGILFDLGVGGPFADLLVRTADPELVAVLRAAEGSAVDDPAHDLTGVLTAPGVARIVRTAAGRIETGEPLRVPLTDLRGGRTHPPTAPVPDDRVPCVVVAPAHPAMDGTGRPMPFDRGRHAAFQALLAEHGDPVLGVLKAEVAAAVRANRGPEGALVIDDPAGRATVSVAIRQLLLTDGTSGPLTAWRSRYGAG
jgi:hypothetical protein